MLRASRLTLLVPAVLACAGTAAARAATITVNTVGDGPIGCTLRAAVQDADAPGLPRRRCAAATRGANTIVLPGGAFTLTQQSQLVIAPGATITIAGSGEPQTTISGDGATRIFDVSAGATLRVHDLTLSGGVASTGLAGAGGNGADGYGGGAIANAGTLVLMDDAITASDAGAGGASAGADGGVGGDGGAVFNVGVATFSGVSFVGDDAGAGGEGGPPAQGAAGAGPVGGPGGDGGAIANEGGAITISDSTFTDDVAGSGGEGYTGIAVPGAASGGGDGGNGGDGGAIFSSGGSVSLTNATLTANSAGVGGPAGAGAVPGSGGSGGALAAVAGAALVLRSDTVAGNSAQGAGGGLYAPAPANAGYYPAGVSLADTLLASNPGGNCADSTLLDGGGNLSFGDTTCPATFLSADPRLGPLQSNGGPADTMRLGAGSAAIGRGRGCPSTDSRGVARGGRCAIGAFQAGPPAVTLQSAAGVSSTIARIHTQIVLDAGSGTVTVSYRTAALRPELLTFGLGPSTGPLPVTIVLKRLMPGARYSFTVHIATLDGSASTAPRAFVTARAPAPGSPPSRLHVVWLQG